MHIPPALFHLLLGSLVACTGLPHDQTPNQAYSPPFTLTTPAPDPNLVSHRLLKARQGSPRSSDGRTNFIGWYTVSDAWVSATCPSDDYFAADETYGVCCHRTNPYCDLATVCGGANNNFAVGPSGQADCGPSNTCDTVTVIQTRDSDDARRIIFCIAKSSHYVLPMTWYRVTYPLQHTATITVTRDMTVTATGQAVNSTGKRSGTSSVSPPISSAAWTAAITSFLSLLLSVK